jgi:hypothetical protein
MWRQNPSIAISRAGLAAAAVQRYLDIRRIIIIMDYWYCVPPTTIHLLLRSTAVAAR